MIVSKVLSYGAVMNNYRDNKLIRSDIDLMMAAAGDDMEAFNLLYKKYRKPLYNYILRNIRDRQTAEDVFQQTFLRLYRSRKSYRPTAKFSVYIYTIARRLCINLTKKKKRWSFVKRLSDLVFGKSDESSTTLEDMVEGDESQPAEQVCDGEMGEVLKNALNQLSGNHRESFSLFEIHGYSYKEISQITGANIGTVKSRLNTARKQLRGLLADYLK
ncbi:MAG: sigma-70 family RNA polymerase sigma factor [Candidatus Eremiobacteraeota bacterium]|nr:sigma-70 family RNA polymerase sigma factor [Candidatus Eremiobacteraeota bacterium]